MVQDIIQGRRTDQTTIELPLKIKKQEEKSATFLEDEADQEMAENDESTDFFDSTLFHKKNSFLKITPDKKHDVNKENFFSSDSDADSASWEGNAPNKEKPMKIEKNVEEVKDMEEKKEKEDGEEVNVKTEKKNGGKEDEKKEKENEKEIDEEDRELEKLLRMTDINPNPRPGSASSGENKTEKEKKDPKPKEVSLSDCLDLENENNSTSINQEEQEENATKPENEFFLMLNSQIKKSFLLSSDESLSSSEETERQPKRKLHGRRKRTSKKRKKDDLREFRIPSLSGESSDESGESAKRTADERMLKEEEDSDMSVKSVEFVKKRKGERNKSEADSDSNSDVQQVSSNTENSPVKRRKNIKKILKKENLQVETKQALKMEIERKKRVSERQKLYEKLFPDANNSARLVLDFDPQTKDELVVVEDSLAKQLKPHQKEGVRFMWNCCFESLKRLEEDSGSGCILAHCMGLGKTLQVITLIHTILTHNTGVETVLILCPLNTIRNWLHEFKMWLQNCSGKVKPIDLTPCKSTYRRVLAVKNWARNGGVLIINYEMFRTMIQKDTKNAFASEFLDPGPDLVVCDEGHLLKNEDTALSKCMSKVKTSRRIVLTGTPLQNNLIEYHCMVQFVKPNILGTKKEFCNRFVNPINNGQFEDSTELDVKIMKRRSHVLHSMLDGFIQRYGYYVLTPFLPEKQEYVISIALTEQQENIYRFFIEKCSRNNRELMKDYHWLQKIWTHPWVMMEHANKRNIDEETKNQCKSFLMEDYEQLHSSGKLVLLFDIIRRCREVGDKVLVFSQSLFSLNLIEYFLKKANEEFERDVTSEFADRWVNGLDYFRLDGSTSSETRDVYCQKFNNVEDERLRLFLVSTKAGGLGINLVAANRVIVFDASWNPTHDVQSIFRVYRFGQNKPCFIYRFLAAATIEEKIYRRQVTKLSLAHRILDEHQIERHYTLGNLQELYTYDPVPKSKWEIPKIPGDNVFAEILKKNRDIIVGYHEHDSLLENKEEEVLTEEERKAAWDDYEKEKLLPQQFNGIPTSLNVKNNEKPGVMPQGILLPLQNQMCRIVNVRTLHGVNGTPDTERLLEIGQSFGMKPFKEENLEKYCKRINETLQMIFPEGNSNCEGKNSADKQTEVP